MTDFFAAMEPMQRFYWYLAIGASVVFLIQTVMTFVGADADTGGDPDFDGNFDGGEFPFQLFSLRNLINFVLGFGWGGASLYDAIDNNYILAGAAFLIGAFFIGIFFYIMKMMMKLSEDNTFALEMTIGKSGDVYLTIPAARKGKGKVFISVQGSTRELDAITDHKEPIGQSVLVKVIALEGDLLVVEPLSKEL